MRRLCKNPKHIAWASWTILANNPINTSFYSLLQIAEGIIQLLYILIILARLHYSNLTDYAINNNLQQTQQGTNSYHQSKTVMSNSTSNDISNTQQLSTSYYIDSPGISYKQIKQLDNFLSDYTISNNNIFWLSLTISILSLTLVILLSILIMALCIKSHVGLQKPNLLKKMQCFILILLMTILQMPLLDILFRNLVTISDPNVGVSLQIVKYGISILTIILFGILMLYIVRLFNLCIPTEDIPWCYPVSKIVFLNLFLKVAIVGCVVFDQQGSYVLIEVICILILQGFLGIYRLLFSPNYQPLIDLIVKTRDFINVLALIVGIGCKIVGDQRNYDLVYIICFSPIVTMGWKIVEGMRNQQMLLKLKNKTLKLELEYEYILYTLMMLISTTTKDSLDTQKVFGQLMDIMIVHINECDDQLCICDELENFYELMRYKYLNNSEVFTLEREERTKYKKIIDDQGLVGTISNLTDTTIKTHSTESTILKNNNEMDRLNMQEEAELLERQNLKVDQLEAHEKEKKAQNKRKKKRTYKINIDETKFRFLSELIYLFYFELKSKFPDSFKIQLLSNYFALKYKKKDMLCIFQLRSFNVQKLSILDQITYIINERFLLTQIEIDQRAQQIISNENGMAYNLNGEYFIKINQLYKNFNICIETLSACVVNFWKDFERESINVDKLQKEGIVIAQNIQSTFRVFQDLDAIKLFKDYQMYFQFAIVQLHILNDQLAYDLYINKMKSIIETNRMFEKNFSSEKDSDYSNFVIADANGSRFGQILQLNNSLRHLLEWNENEQSRSTIESFMPGLIREKHPQFLDRYNKTGQSFIINNKTCMFVKKNNGYIIPVELFIKFHYSIEYQYVYLAIMKPFYEMSPFGNGVKYNIDQLIFLMTDNEDGRITEYSESCRQLLKFSKRYNADGIIKRVDELIDNFYFKEFKKGRQTRYITNDIYEEVQYLDFSVLKDVTEVDIDNRLFNLVNSNLFEKLTKVRTRVFEERYSGGVLDINLFCFYIINENEESADGLSRNFFLQNTPLSQINQQQHIGAAELDKIKEEEYSQSASIKGDSQSATGSSSSAIGTTISMSDYRNFHSFSSQNTPKSLKIIIQLLVILYIIMIIISCVNLGINVARQRQSEYDVHVVKDANDRMNLISINLLISRVLLNIANGYETNDSLLIKDRFKEYQNLQEAKIQQLRIAQSNLQQSSFANSKEIDDMLNTPSLKLYYLDERNNIYQKQENVDISYNLYIARVADLNSMEMSQMKGQLDFQTLIPNPAYKPSIQEQQLYFTIENGNKGFRWAAVTLASLYARESEYHAEQNIGSTKVTTIISVITIFVIGVIIAPLLTRAEIRKYKALLYFLKIPASTFPQMIKNCEYCLNMNDENRYDDIMKDYESYLGIKIRNQQVEQLRKERDQNLNVLNQDASQGFTSDNTSSYLQMGGNGSMASGRFQNIGKVQKELNQEDKDSFKRQTSYSSISATPRMQQQVQQKGISLKEILIENNKAKKQREAKKEISKPIIEEDDDQNQDYQGHDQEVIENSRSINLNGNKKSGIVSLQSFEQIKQKKDKSYQNKSINSFYSQSLDNENNKKINEQSKITHLADIVQETQEDRQRNIKKNTIKQRAYRRRSAMIFFTILAIVLVSVYFIIAYFLAIKTFEAAMDVIKSLELIFYKGSCFDSTMNFLRENEIRFSSKIYLEEYNNVSASDYYLDFCLQKEAQYSQLKMNIPPYFEEARGLIESLDSRAMCDTVYVGEYQYLHELCKTSLNGILKQGMSNAFYYMYSKILKDNLKSNDNYIQKNMDLQLKLLNDPEIIQIIDMKAKLFDPTLTLLKDKCINSVVTYIQGLLNDFIVAFIVFVLLLTFASAILLFIGFKKLRRNMWETNILIKIIPFEAIDKKDRIKIKDFFNS